MFRKVATALYEGVRDVMGVKEDPPDPFSDDIQEMNENHVSIEEILYWYGGAKMFRCSVVENVQKMATFQ